MPRLARIGLLAAGAIGCVPAPAPAPPPMPATPVASGPAANPPVSFGPVVTPPGWKRVQAQGAYTFAVPAGFERSWVSGIDSAVDEFRGPGIVLIFDYGMYGGGLGGANAVPQGALQSGEWRGGWLMHRTEDAAKPWGFRARYDPAPAPGASAGVPPPPGVGLTIVAHCETQQACAVAPEVARSVRFGAPAPLLTRAVLVTRPAEPEGAQALEGRLVLDDDGCFRLVGPDNRAGPPLVWPAGVRLAAAEDPRNVRLSGGFGGDTVLLAGHYWIHASGRRAQAAGLSGLDRPMPLACGPEVFVVSAWETPRGRELRGGPFRSLAR